MHNLPSAPHVKSKRPRGLGDPAQLTPALPSDPVSLMPRYPGHQALAPTTFTKPVSLGASALGDLVWDATPLPPVHPSPRPVLCTVGTLSTLWPQVRCDHLRKDTPVTTQTITFFVFFMAFISRYDALIYSCTCYFSDILIAMLAS